MLGAAILILLIVALVAIACWTGREPNSGGGSAGDSTGASRGQAGWGE